MKINASKTGSVDSKLTHFWKVKNAKFTKFKKCNLRKKGHSYLKYANINKKAAIKHEQKIYFKWLSRSISICDFKDN